MLKLHALIIYFLMCYSVSIAQPTADFNASPTTGCAPLHVQFTNTSAGNPTSYQWDLGNGINPNIANPSTIYDKAGTYTVKLTVSNASGSNSIVKTGYIVVRDTPKVDFNAVPTTGCTPLTVNFTDVTGGTGNQYSWFFGNGNTSNAQNPTNIYSGAPGTSTVTLIVKNSFGCTGSKTKTNYITTKLGPSGSFTANQQIFCAAPAIVNFTGNGTGGTVPYTYTWQFGDAGTGTGGSVSHTYNPPTTPASYNVSMQVKDANGCTANLSSNNFIRIERTVASFNAPAQACAGVPVSFTNSSIPSIANTFWDFGGFGFSSDKNPTFSFPLPGTFNVKLTINNGPCSETITKQIKINPLPTVDFILPNPAPCPAPIGVQFVASGTGTNYTWDFGDGSALGAGASTTHNYSANGSYTVILTARDANGCVNSIKKDNVVNIFPLDLVLFTDKPGGCIPVTIQFNNKLTQDGIVPYPYPVASYEWDFGDGSPTSNLANPAHTYTLYGTHTATLKVKTVNGCTITDVISIKAGIKPVPSFTATPTTVCSGQPVRFTNTTIDGINYEWQFGDGRGSTDVNPTHIYGPPGDYSVTLTAENLECKETITKINYIKVLPAYAEFKPIYDCPEPRKVKFQNTSIGATSYVWDFGDGSPQTAIAAPEYTYPALGNYVPRLIAINNVTGCKDTLDIPIELYKPTITFSTPDTAICRDTWLNFQGATANGFVDHQFSVWYVDNIPKGTRDMIDIYFFPPGYHKVKWVITDGHNCVDSLVKNNYIFVSHPAPAFTATPIAGCAPLKVNFTDQTVNLPGATTANRTWDFGNGNKINGTPLNVAETYMKGGSYDVKLVVVDNVGCTDSITKVGYIRPSRPTADFSVSKSGACIKENLAFTNKTLNGNNFSWTFGDNNASNNFSPVHAYGAVGSYDVRLISADANGCKDTMTKPAAVSITKPTASFTVSDTLGVCPPFPVTFTNTSIGATDYEWNFGNGNTSIKANPTEIYTVPAQNKVKMIAKDANQCADTADDLTIHLLGYAGTLKYTPLTGCSPFTIDFSATIPNVPSIIWDFSDGNTEQVTSPTTQHTYIQTGKFVPKLIFKDNSGCQSLGYGIDTIRVDATIADFTVGPACEGGVVTFTDASTSVFSSLFSWKWTFDDGTTATGKFPTKYYPKAGKYPVTIVVGNRNDCMDTLTKEIEIHTLPQVSAGLDTTICLKDTAMLTGTGASKYVWTPAATITCADCPNTLAGPTKPTTYTVIGTDKNGCSDTDKVIVDIKTKVKATVGPDGEICRDELISLSAKGAHSYLWVPATGLDNDKSANPIARPIDNIRYTLVGYEGRCIPDTHFVNIVVHPKPTIKALGEGTIVAGNTIDLLAEGTLIHKFAWSPAENLSCVNCSNPVAKPFKTTTYTAIAYTEYECADSSHVTVKVLCDESQVFIPNTFSPNGDGENDRFYPRGVGIDNVRSFRIYNRYGELVFERGGFSVNDASKGWDGTFRGNALEPDVFVYVVEAYCNTGELFTWKGDITIIR